jgi:hypothetical protein
VVSASLKVGAFEERKEITEQAEAVRFTAKLIAGKTKLEASFLDESGKHVTAAYYVTVTHTRNFIFWLWRRHQIAIHFPQGGQAAPSNIAPKRKSCRWSAECFLEGICRQPCGSGCHEGRPRWAGWTLNRGSMQCYETIRFLMGFVGICSHSRS